MTDAKPTHAPLPPPPARGLGALLSFLVPGVGQVYQGIISRDRNRWTKGLFFFVTLYGMFFYGMWLGQWKNVYLPHVQEQLIRDKKPLTLLGVPLSPFAGDLYTRLQYAGQFWIGIAAWPALWNYFVPETPIISSFQASPGAVKNRDEFHRQEEATRKTEQEHNALQISPAMGKRWDIAWVYTVIAGVLNLLVIYDAWAGPVYRRPEDAAAKGGAA
jgi:hypothetical protein